MCEAQLRFQEKVQSALRELNRKHILFGLESRMYKLWLKKILFNDSSLTIHSLDELSDKVNLIEEIYQEDSWNGHVFLVYLF